MSEPLSVLWWGRTVITTGPDGETVRALLPAEGDPVAALADFTERLEPAPAVIRLFYHAPELAPVATTCPRGDRRTVQQALGVRFPAVAEPLSVWAAHRVRASGSGSTTLLYLEQEGRLRSLQAELGDRRISLEAAFPILTLVEAAPPLTALHKPVIALVHTDDACAVFWRTAEGDRHAAFFDGATGAGRALRELATGFSVFKDPPAFAVIDLGTAPFDLGPVAQRPTLKAGPKEFLAPAATLDPREICNFFPPPLFFTADRICQVAAAILFVAGLVVTGVHIASSRTTGASQALQAAEIGQLEQRVQRLRANQTQIEATKTLAEEVVIAPPNKRVFLEELGRDRPPELSIASVTLNERTWSVSGVAHAGIGMEKGPYENFVGRFGTHTGWTLAETSRIKMIKGPNFTLAGSFP